RVRVPVWLAIPLVAVAWAAAIWGAWKFFRPVLKRGSMKSAAALADAAIPDSEERISSAVELSQEKNPQFRGSPELIACLVRQAEYHISSIDPASVISGKVVFRWLMSFVALAILWFVLLVLLTPNMLVGLQRTFAPWSAASALAAPDLAVQPGDITVKQGETVTITLEVRAATSLTLDNGNQEIPRAALLQHFPQASAGVAIPDRTIEMERTGPRSFRMAFDNVQQGFTYQVNVDGGESAGPAQ